MRPSTTASLLGLAVALAILLRALGFEWVFVDSNTVIFAPGDAQYHLRRALYGWSNFPEVLFFDPYINFPGGAAISWPPLFDFVVSAVGRVFARDLHAFQVMAAWVAPVFGALVLFPVYAVGRRLGGAWIGLGSAALMAILPMSVTYSRLGQLDHHCAVAFIGACLLWVLVRLVEERRPSPALGGALALLAIAILLTWHGSLLYLLLVEGVLWIAAALETGDEERLALYRVQTLSAALTVVVVAPLSLLFPEPLGGPWSAIAFSRLHVVAMAAVAIVSGLLWWLETRRISASPLARLSWTVALGLAVLACLWALPATREGLEPALRFVTLRDGVGHRTGEQSPLFSLFGRDSGRPVHQVWGLLGYGLPLLPFAVVWASPRERRRGAWVVAAWCAWFGSLALLQRRYGNDLGPAAAVGFALVLAAICERAVSKLGGVPALARAGAVALALLSFAPPILGEWLPRASRSATSLMAGEARGDRALRTPAGSLTRFLERVRLLTPPTSGYLDARVEPEYGIVSHANLGHAIQNVARRATPTDPFWAFIGAENWDAAFGLLSAASEDEARGLAQRLRAPYLITHSSADPESFEGWLHHDYGRPGSERPAAAHLRLLIEGPRDGAHFLRRRPAPRARRGSVAMPYRLFEWVEGARVRVEAAPGAEVVATLRLNVPGGRRLSLEWKQAAGPDGVAWLTLPYPTRPPPRANYVPGMRAEAFGPYRLTSAGRSLPLPVSEQQVQTGSELSISLASPLSAVAEPGSEARSAPHR